MDLTKRKNALDLVTRYYTAFNNNDKKEMMSCLSDDIIHDVNQGSRRIGKAAFEEFSNHMDECYAEQLEEMVIMASDDGNHAAAEFIVNGRYKKTDSGLPDANNQTYRLPAGAFLAIEKGKITRVTTYYNLEDWIKQVKAA